MSCEREEEFSLDVDRVDHYLRRTPVEIERDRAKTANIVAVALVAGVIMSLPCHLIALAIAPSSSESIAQVFSQWNSVVSPLTGAAIGAYYATRGDQRSGGR